MAVPLTPEQALSRLAALCSRGEQAESDLRSKLNKWGISARQANEIIHRLKADNYLNEERYARAFVRDKFRCNAWGRVKIAYALRQKQVSGDAIDMAMEEIYDDDYHSTLMRLLRNKMRTVGQREQYALRAALLRFAASRGFEAEWCYRCVDEVMKGPK